MNDTTREVGGSIGIAIVGSLLAVGYRRGVDGTVSDLTERLGQAGGFVDSARDSIGRALAVSANLQIVAWAAKQGNFEMLRLLRLTAA